MICKSKLEYGMTRSKIEEAVGEVEKLLCSHMLVGIETYPLEEEKKGGPFTTLYLVRTKGKAVSLVVEVVPFNQTIEVSVDWTGKTTTESSDESIESILRTWEREIRRLLLERDES